MGLRGGPDILHTCLPDDPPCETLKSARISQGVGVFRKKDYFCGTYHTVIPPFF